MIIGTVTEGSYGVEGYDRACCYIMSISPI
jgi:hypothetical protein